MGVIESRWRLRRERANIRTRERHSRACACVCTTPTRGGRGSGPARVVVLFRLIFTNGPVAAIGEPPLEKSIHSRAPALSKRKSPVTGARRGAMRARAAAARLSRTRAAARPALGRAGVSSADAGTRYVRRGSRLRRHTCNTHIDWWITCRLETAVLVADRRARMQNA
ncbi:hypothetical protein EVAR_45551_1 [Eumeta japonica]|uniref:Uncharacterized protein n=1 Tax=Eumeta variegata TaxID=151549 RepID=A0A4C1X6G9_EUMVA|nr:hypothetical protein EVAR_45551_1 [Eumeta japonica]